MNSLIERVAGACDVNRNASVRSATSRFGRSPDKRAVNADKQQMCRKFSSLNVVFNCYHQIMSLDDDDEDDDDDDDDDDDVFFKK